SYSVHHGIRRVHCEHALYSEHDASDLWRRCRTYWSTSATRWRCGCLGDQVRRMSMWNFLLGFLFARATGAARIIRPLLLLLLVGVIIAGLIYAFAIFH